MYFKDERHKASFTNAVKGLNQKDRKLMSKIYLLSADRALWRAARRELKGNRLPLNKIRLFVLSVLICGRRKLCGKTGGMF